MAGLEKKDFIEWIKKILHSKLNNCFVLFDKKKLTLNFVFSKFTKNVIYKKNLF